LFVVFASAILGLTLVYARGTLELKNFAFSIFGLLGFATFTLHTEYFWNILQISRIREDGALYVLENKLGIGNIQISKSSISFSCFQDVSLPSSRGRLTGLLVEHQGNIFASVLRNADCPQAGKTWFEVKRFQSASKTEKEALTARDNLINGSFFALLGLTVLGIGFTEYGLGKRRS
jgi:hypothetical protein